jgi:DnaJ domain
MSSSPTRVEMDDDCRRISELSEDATHYQVLNIDPSDINTETCRKKYLTLSLKCHPDKHTNEKDVYTKIFQKINAAKDICDDDERAKRESESSAAAAGTKGSDYSSDKNDLDLSPHELDKRNLERFGPLKKKGEDERIQALQVWLSAWLSTIEKDIPAHGELTFEGVQNILTKISPYYRDYFTKSSIIQELHYQIINALIKKLIENVHQLDSKTNEWILHQITVMTSIRGGIILPEHGDLFLDDNLFETIFTKELRERRSRLYNMIVRYRNINRQTKLPEQGGSRRKSMHNRRNLRNKCQTKRKNTRRRNRKNRKSK